MKRIAILAAALSVVLLAAYYAITVYDELNPFGRMWETPAVKPHEKPLLVMESGLVPFHGGELATRTRAPGIADAPLPLAEPAVVNAGRTLYGRYCGFCHGRNHDGNGTVGQSFAPLPHDLRSPAVQKLSVGELFQHISYGVPDGRQPPLATTVSPTDRWRIIAYVRSLGLRE